MVKVLIHGCNGRMGQMVTGLIREDEQAEVVAGVDTFTATENTYPVFENIQLCDVKPDVVIDFSNAAAVEGLLDYCTANQVPAVP